VRALRWRRSAEHRPAVVYHAERFEIIWDPAGPTEGERGGWYVYRGGMRLGILPTLAAAKTLAEVAR
jgi:hypothetical protein